MPSDSMPLATATILQPSVDGIGMNPVRGRTAPIVNRWLDLPR